MKLHEFTLNLTGAFFQIPKCIKCLKLAFIPKLMRIQISPLALNGYNRQNPAIITASTTYAPVGALFIIKFSFKIKDKREDK